MSQLFKMRHIPSGLFATSALPKYTGGDNDLTRLSVEGKIYTRKPKLPTNTFGVIFPKSEDSGGYYDYSEPKDWELVVYELNELHTIKVNECQ